MWFFWFFHKGLPFYLLCIWFYMICVYDLSAYSNKTNLFSWIQQKNLRPIFKLQNCLLFYLFILEYEFVDNLTKKNQNVFNSLHQHRKHVYSRSEFVNCLTFLHAFTSINSMILLLLVFNDLTWIWSVKSKKKCFFNQVRIFLREFSLFFNRWWNLKVATIFYILIWREKNHFNLLQKYICRSNCLNYIKLTHKNNVYCFNFAMQSDNRVKDIQTLISVRNKWTTCSNGTFVLFSILFSFQNKDIL